MNHVILIGRLTRDPEKRSTQNGKNVTNMTLAVQRPFKNTDGYYDSDFIPCVVYGVIAENTAVYCHKGDLTAVSGRLQVRNYDDNNGVKHYVTEVIADKVMFLGQKKQEHNSENDIEVNATSNDPYADMGNEVQLDESDLPFDFN